MRIAVIGGGIAGLTAAHRLARGRTGEVVLLEAGSRLGGHAASVREDGFLVEAGPNGFLDRASDPEVMDLVREVGLSEEVVPASVSSKRRYVLRGGRLRRVPDSPQSLLSTDVLSAGGKLRLLLEPWARRAAPRVEESVYDFARRRIGKEAAEVLVDAAVAGISAGDSRALSVAAAFPLMVEMERDHGSLIRAMFARRQRAPRLVSFARGMSSLVERLARRLGETARVGSPVHRLARVRGSWSVMLESGERIAADRVLLALPARDAAPLLAEHDAALARTLDSFPYAGVSVVALAFRAGDLARDLEGYGYLTARSEGLETLGVVWDSSLFPGRAPEGIALVRAILGGARNPGVVRKTEGELVADALRELAPILGHAHPLRTWVWRWPQAIAQYTHGHLDRMAEVRRRVAALDGLDVCGSSYEGVAFTGALLSGERAAARAQAVANGLGNGVAEGRLTSLSLAERA